MIIHEKHDLSDFNCGMVVPWWAGLIISETADHLIFMHNNSLCSFILWVEKLFVKRDQKRMARLIQPDRKANVTQMTTLYSHVEQKSVS